MLAVVALVVVVLAARCSSPADRSVHVVAVGDIACAEDDPAFVDDPGTPATTAVALAASTPVAGPSPLRCQQQATADLAVAQAPDLVAGLGDYQYEQARARSYDTVYAPGWGRLRDRTRPALGNQEYKVHAANTYFDYFGDQAGPRRGWYAYDVGAWHVVVLNSNCDLAGGCGPDSEQVRWLRRDLDDHAGARCTMAYWHHPRFSDGLRGSDARSATFWSVLDEHGADVVLAAHEHDYQRFTPLAADGRAVTSGITSFVVGTGGQATYAPEPSSTESGRRRAVAQSASRVDDAVGVLDLTLDPAGFSWRYLDTDGRTRDQGSQACR